MDSQSSKQVRKFEGQHVEAIHSPILLSSNPRMTTSAPVAQKAAGARILSPAGQTLSDLAPTNPLMVAPWIGCLQWAISTDEIVEAFREQTGNNWHPSQIPIENMIDEATGADRDFILSFARWVNRNIWGEVDGRACNGDELELSDSPVQPTQAEAGGGK